MDFISNYGKKLNAKIKHTINFYESKFRYPVEKQSRIRVTIPFRICKDDKPDEALEKAFLSEAEKKYSLKELKGHRSVGGIRSSIFNAMSLEEVEMLANFMKEFQNAN